MSRLDVLARLVSKRRVPDLSRQLKWLVTEEVCDLELNAGRRSASRPEGRLFCFTSVVDGAGCEAIERPITSAPPVFVTVSWRSRSAWRIDQESSISSGPGVASPSRNIMEATPSRIAVSETASPSVGGEEGGSTPMNRRREPGSRGETTASLDDVRLVGESGRSCGGFEV